MTPDDGTVMGAARALGSLLDRDEIKRLEPISDHLFRCRRRDVWPPEVLAEMDAIWKGPGL